MAHLIETMAYVNATPWHGLGEKLEPKQPLEVWAEKAGLNFEILDSPVHYQTAKNGSDSIILPFEDQKVLYRSDTKAALSVVSSRYQVVQPEEILEFYRDLTEIAGYEMETAGVLKGGRKIWALARTGDSISVKGNDLINGYLLLATACDGTLATTAQFTSVRVVCNNTLALAVGDKAHAVKVPHSTTFDAEEVKRKLGVSISGWDRFKHHMHALADRKVNDQESENFIRKVFGADMDEGYISLNQYAMKKVQTLFEGHGRGAELQSARGTAFGLLNAVTEFVDHEKRARDSSARLDSAWFGKGASLKQKALDTALAMV